MITERTLKRWRKDALKDATDVKIYEGTCFGLATVYQECQTRILRMTQELLDLHLIRK